MVNQHRNGLLTPWGYNATHGVPQLTLEGGTVTYCGTYDSGTQTWTLTGTGTYTNPTGGTTPIEMMYLSAWSTLMSSSIASLRATMTK